MTSRARTFFPVKGRGLADFESAKRGICKRPLQSAANSRANAALHSLAKRRAKKILLTPGNPRANPGIRPGISYGKQGCSRGLADLPDAAAAQGRFQPSGKRLQLFRQYNVSADTGAFEIPQSSSRLPDASTLQSVEVRPARKHLHAQPVPCVPVRAFLGWMRARASTAVPIPSRARSFTYACSTPLREGWSMRA
jgi:hypothetical protein